MVLDVDIGDPAERSTSLPAPARFVVLVAACERRDASGLGTLAARMLTGQRERLILRPGTRSAHPSDPGADRRHPSIAAALAPAGDLARRTAPRSTW